MYSQYLHYKGQLRVSICFRFRIQIINYITQMLDGLDWSSYLCEVFIYPSNCDVICCPLQLKLSFEEKPNSVGPSSCPNLNNSYITHLFDSAFAFEGAVVMDYIKHKNRRKIIDKSSCLHSDNKGPCCTMSYMICLQDVFWTSNPGKTYLSRCVTSFLLRRTRFWFLKYGNSTNEIVEVVFNWVIENNSCLMLP